MAAPTLAERIRKERQRTLPLPSIAGAALIIQRPSAAELTELLTGQSVQPTALLRFVVGWTGVLESHLLAGGSAVPVPFDAEAAAEWLRDRPEDIALVSETVLQMVREHRDAAAAREKN